MRRPPFERLHRPFLLTAGMLSLVIGVLALFVPLVPTTPFLLIATACFSRSSRRMHAWLIGNRWFGPSLREWEETGAIQRRIKVFATVLMVGLIAYPVGFLAIHVVAKGFAVATVVGVLWFIWTRPDA